MQEELVSFETAKLAKEKSFNCKTACYYVNIKTTKSKINIQLRHKIEGSNPTLIFDNNKIKARISAPTQSLLQKWLREVHNIRVYIEQKVAGDFGFVIYILNPEENKRASIPWIRSSYFTHHFETYERALEQGLLEGLKLIKD